MTVQIPEPQQFPSDAPAEPFVELFCAMVNDAAAIVYKNRDATPDVRTLHAAEFLSETAPGICEKLGVIDDGDAIRRWVADPHEIDGVSQGELAALLGRSEAFVANRVADGTIPAVRNPFYQCGKRMVIARRDVERIVGSGVLRGGKE